VSYFQVTRTTTDGEPAQPGSCRRAQGSRPGRPRCERAAAAGSATSRSSIWAIITGGSAVAEKPPPARTMRAALGGRGHDRRFLHRHGNQVVALVDLEVERHAQGQGIDTHDILNHAGRVCRSKAAGVQQRQVITGQSACAANSRAPIRQRTSDENSGMRELCCLSDIKGFPLIRPAAPRRSDGRRRSEPARHPIPKRRAGTRARTTPRLSGVANRATPTSPPPAPEGWHRRPTHGPEQPPAQKRRSRSFTPAGLAQFGHLSGHSDPQPPRRRWRAPRPIRSRKRSAVVRSAPISMR